jgi:hypothetical protein
MKPSQAQQVVEQLLSEGTGGAYLSTEDLRQAYLVDFTGDPGFDDSYFLRHKDGKYEYKVLGHYNGTSDNGEFYVTSFFVDPIEGPHGTSWVGDFPGVTDIDTDDEEEAKKVFNSTRPKTRFSASLKKPTPPPARESKLQEREWKVSLGVDLDQYDEDADIEEIKSDLVAKLKAKVEAVRTALGTEDAAMLERFISDIEDAVETEDVDSAMADIYDWADAVGVWVGGE